jgi:hypothetical protein
VLRWVDRSGQSDLALRPTRRIFTLVGGSELFSVGILALSRFRLAVRIPERVAVPGVPAIFLVREMSQGAERGPDGRHLH